MAYIDWWNRTGPITMGERFGLNEISTARNTLSPTKSYAKKPYNWEEGDWTDPNDESVGGTKILEDFEITEEMRRRPNVDGGRIGFSKGTDAVREYLSALESGTKVQPAVLAKEYNVNRRHLYTILENEFPELKFLGRTEAAKLTQKRLSEKRLTTAVDVPTPISKLRRPGSQTRDYVDVRWPSDKIKENYIEDFKQKRSGTKAGKSGLSNEQLAKKYFGKVNNTTLSNVERVNNVLQKQLDIKYKEGDPKEFIKKRKRRLSIVQGGKYIGGTEKFPFHHIMPIGGETAITTKDVTILSKLMNSKLAPYNKKLNDIADAVSNLYTERSDGFQKRIDQLQKNAEQIINKVKNELPKKYQGLIGFTKLEPIYDEYGTILRLQANRIGIDEAKSIEGVTGKAEEIGKMSSKRFSEFKKIFKNLPSKEIEKIGEVIGCGRKKAEGGRIGFGVGSGSMLACIDAKFEKDPKEFWKRTANIGSRGLDKLWFYAAPYWFPSVIAATGRLEAFKDPTKPEMWWDIMLASDAVKRWGLDEASLSQLKNASWTRRLRIINDLLLKFPGDKILTQAAKVARPLIVLTESLSAAKGIKSELDLVKEYASKNNIPYEKARLAYYASGAALKPRWEGDKSFKSWAFSKLTGGANLYALALEKRKDSEFQNMGTEIFEYISKYKPEPVEEEKVTEKVTPHGTGPVDWALNMKAQMKEKEPPKYAAVDSYFMGGIASLIK